MNDIKLKHRNEITHTCDTCRNVFKDDKSDMDHCMDNNGLVLCENCKNVENV